MGRAESHWRVVWGPLALLFVSSGLGLCPPRWIPYRDERCLYLPATPALSWKEARIFCQGQKADLVVIKDYSKQMFLRDLTEGARGHASYFWIGLAWQEAQLTWVDGTPISQSWYSYWLQGHPRKDRCVQLVGIYAGQWRDWDCDASTSFICEMPIRDAFSSTTRKAHFRSHCYAFHFPSFWEQRSWTEAQSFCQELGGNLAIIHDEEENAFLSSAFPEDGWHMWIGLRLGALWKWSDSSPPTYLRWHSAPSSAGLDRCAVLSLRPLDAEQHGTWEARPCRVRPAAEATGFICQLPHDFCGPPESVQFPLPGGMGVYATADVTFSLSDHATCSLALTCFHPNGTLFWIVFEYNATHMHGSIFTEQGRFLVRRDYPHAPFPPGLNTWSFVTYPDGFACFFNHQEHFRLSDSQDVFLANISSLQISGVTVANASLEYRLSSDLHFPYGSSLQLADAIHRYLGNFTIGLWIRSTFLDSPRMCVVSYSLAWQQQAEFALFLLSPSGLEFHIKGAVLFSGTRVFLLDGSWHHLAVSVSNAPGVPPVKVFVDGETWEPDVSESSGFLWKGLSLGGKLSVGQLEVGSRGTSFYVGDLSEMNLWDRALSEFSVKQLAALRTRWKFPGNVVSWSQLVAKKPPSVQISPPSEEPARAFAWFGLLRLRGKDLVLCTDSERSVLHTRPLSGQCATRAFWGLQLNGRLRNVADPPACLLVAPDGFSALSSLDCSPDPRSTFRLLPDLRLQNLHSGLCLFQDVTHSQLCLGQCAPQALYFFLDWDVHCPHSRGWRSWKDKCLFFVLDAALEWSQAQRFCQRFHGGSLLSLNSPQDLIWLQGELPGSIWTGLYGSGRDLWSWADGSQFSQALRRFMFSPGPSSVAVCMLALTSGFLKAEPCHRPHRWVCQAPRQSDSYMTFPGKSFDGARSAELSFPSLQAAKQQCSALGKGCDVVVGTVAGHHLMVGRRFVTLEDPGAAAAVHVKTRCSPGYSGRDCQSMCPRCEPSLSCNPLTGLCDGFLHYREAPVNPLLPAVVASLKCLPLDVWIFERGSCWSYERYSSQAEANAVCQRYLGSTVRKVQPPSKIPADLSADGRRGFQQPSGSLWACQREEDVELPSFREKLLLSPQDAPPEQRHASLQEAEDACYLQKERCTGLLSLKGAAYTVAGTVLVGGPGSGALLSVKAACSPGFCGRHCQRRCSPCLGTRTYNPLTGRCDGLLSCVHRFSPSCLHGLVHSRCPRDPGWWFWGGHCYYVEERSSKSWQEAKAACQAYGENVDLLVLSSPKEKAWAAAMVQRGSWTGLNDADGDGAWRWGAGQADSLSPAWLPDVPLATGGCVEIRPTGDQGLAASPCSHLKPWVCEGTWAPRSSCPAEPGWSYWNGSCYFWDPSSAATWPKAREACRRFRKTELLFLTSLQEMDWVRSRFQGSFWTGLNDREEESVFRWTAREPLSEPGVAEYLRDDTANGGLKDCVWFDSATGFLSDASCGEERPFLCKCHEATEWFDQWTGQGVAGEPSLLYPSAETLEEAKRECLLERPVCVAVLETRSGSYLLSSKDDVISRADSVLHVWTICAEGFSGPACRRTLAHSPRPACDCSGKLETTAEKVCGVPVQMCVEDCRRMTTWTNCSLCIPACTEASMSFLDPEEFALVTMIQFRVSHSLNLTTEDERDRAASSKIIYDTKYP